MSTIFTFHVTSDFHIFFIPAQQFTGVSLKPLKYLFITHWNKVYCQYIFFPTGQSLDVCVFMDTFLPIFYFGNLFALEIFY